MGINASWGVGKTTFVKLWKSYLENELRVHSIYFSAWEDDFSKEPLISIMGELNTYITNKFPKDRNLIKKLDELRLLSGKIIKRGLPALIKGATAGALDLDGGIESAIGAVTESVAKELIESYESDKAITIKFKELLYSIIEKIDSEKPLVVFIDELDRCRPLYAIELLERLKHIFGIEKLIFVLSIDKEQLSQSIKSQYGDIDTDNYLRRFIDLEYSLDNPKIENFISYLISFHDLYTLFNSKNYDIENLIDTINILSKELDLSLREIEHIFFRISIIIRSIDHATTTIISPRRKTHETIYIFRLISFLLIIKTKFPEHYNSKSFDNIKNSIVKNREKNEFDEKIYNYMVKDILEDYKDNTSLEEMMNIAFNKVELSYKFYYATE